MNNVLVTGSWGLVGAEAVRYFDSRADTVVGLDNDQRADFFGPLGGTASLGHRLQEECGNYRHFGVDIRDAEGVSRLVAEFKPGLIVHCAAQPSHEFAATNPVVDFQVNAVGTQNLLEAARLHVPETVFAHLSTNKVYGDQPNNAELVELETRFDIIDPVWKTGFSESLPVDRCLHSLFGASKLAADIMVQEYGRYFGIKTACFRAGCITGPDHSGVEQHGFLSYLVRRVSEGRSYKIIGFGGKQVRDQIHAYDVVTAIDEFYRNPSCGAVYNIGGEKQNSLSVLEALGAVGAICDKEPEVIHSAEVRIGDHICYYSDMSQFRSDFPEWKRKYDIETILTEMVDRSLASRVRHEEFAGHHW